MDYLTEEKLGIILKDIFKNETIIPQFKHGRKRIDYCVELDVKSEHPVMDNLSDFFFDFEEDEYLSLEKFYKHLKPELVEEIHQDEIINLMRSFCLNGY